MKMSQKNSNLIFLILAQITRLIHASEWENSCSRMAQILKERGYLNEQILIHIILPGTLTIRKKLKLNLIFEQSNFSIPFEVFLSLDQP